MDHKTNVKELKDIVQKFCEDRDWDQFHNAKDLAIGISTEAAELLQIFRFKTEEDIQELFKDEKRKKEITEEMSDVLYFLLRLAQKYNVDLTEELKQKLEKNKIKYPIHKAKGNKKKYSEY